MQKESILSKEERNRKSYQRKWFPPENKRNPKRNRSQGQSPKFIPRAPRAKRCNLSIFFARSTRKNMILAFSRAEKCSFLIFFSRTPRAKTCFPSVPLRGKSSIIQFFRVFRASNAISNVFLRQKCAIVPLPSRDLGA